MGDWSRLAQEFDDLPEARALLADPRPAWIWASDASRILWANAAGGRKLGARRIGDLSERRYADSHPLRRDLQNAAVKAPSGGTLARLRLVDSPRAAPLTCRIRRVPTPGGEQGILVVEQAHDKVLASAPSASSVLLSGAGEAARQRVSDYLVMENWAAGSEPAVPPAARNGPVRSPIPEWLRTRLATFPAPARSGPQHGPGRLPDSAGLSPQERAAFEEIAAALGSGVGGGGNGVAEVPAGTGEGAQPTQEELQVPAGQAAADGRLHDVQKERQNPSGAVSFVPSAFVLPTAHQPVAAPAGFDAAVASRLREAEGRLRELSSVLDVATDGVVILDGEGRIESLNGSAEALFGVRQADVAGHPFAELLAPESRPAATLYLEGLKTGGVAGLINEGRELEGRAAGGTVPLFVTFGRIGGDEVGRFCAVLRDLTQWKQAEAELVSERRKAEQASRQKSDFLARVSHEIRTPLNGIIGFADIILEERFGPIHNDRYREYVHDVRTSGEHVLSLVNDLLDIAKIEAGKLELDFASVQLNDLARECIMLMQPAASTAKIILRSSLSGDLPPIRADGRTMRQIILNLLSNSVKFTRPGGQVIVSTGQAPDGAVILRVRDTGDGMSDAELVRALEPFRQVGTAAVADRMGTGLGLPLTKALVEANRASFAITSAKGEGTMVKVTFPPGLADPS